MQLMMQMTGMNPNDIDSMGMYGGEDFMGNISLSDFN